MTPSTLRALAEETARKCSEQVYSANRSEVSASAFIVIIESALKRAAMAGAGCDEQFPGELDQGNSLEIVQGVRVALSGKKNSNGSIKKWPKKRWSG